MAYPNKIQIRKKKIKSKIKKISIVGLIVLVVGIGILYNNDSENTVNVPNDDGNTNEYTLKSDDIITEQPEDDSISVIIDGHRLSVNWWPLEE